jgi:hypothetical protein
MFTSLITLLLLWKTKGLLVSIPFFFDCCELRVLNHVSNSEKKFTQTVTKLALNFHKSTLYKAPQEKSPLSQKIAKFEVLLNEFKFLSNSPNMAKIYCFTLQPLNFEYNYLNRDVTFPGRHFVFSFPSQL